MALTRIAGYGHVAMQYGLEESIFLESIMYWWRANKANGRNFYDGRYWTYNTIKALAEIFPWWSAKQVRRIADNCREKGALLIGNYNDDGRDRTIWYSPSDDLLILYGELVPEEPAPEGPPAEGDSICPNGQMHLPERADSFAHLGKALPCIYHVGTNIPPYNPPTGDGTEPKRPKRKRAPKSVPEHSPDRFEQFWEVYPGGGKRIKTVEAWDALKPDDELIDTMAKALKRQMASEQWRNGIGIPHASTWLNQRGWLDKVQESVAPAEPSSGWAPDPEVTG